jgi:N-methylhydantoinase A
MIAYGGNGPVHAWAIAKELGIARVLIPKAAPAFSALGVLVADYVVDLVRSYVVPISRVDLGHLRELMAGVISEADKELAPADLGPDQVTTEVFVQMAYPGQNFDMSVPVPERTELEESGLIDLADRFHDRHEADRGFSFRSQQPVVRGVRIVAHGSTPKPSRLAEVRGTLDGSTPVSSRPVFFGGDHIDTPVHDGSELAVGATVRGPAIIEEPFTVVVVPPGATCRLGDHLSYELTFET